MAAEPLPQNLRTAALSLISGAGYGADAEFTRLAGGANNQVFRVDAAGATLLLKSYFRHDADPRDRTGAEYAFSRFAWDQGLRCLPEPLLADAENRIALYRFVDGRRLEPGEVGRDEVAQALAFYTDLNSRRSEPRAAALPDASEYRASLAGHLELVDRRVKALGAIDASDAAGREAADFVAAELLPAWTKAARTLETTPGLRDELPASGRCLSPSDFGFHNALRAADGTLSFIDFEYAGWDDPARLVCDFFCQPAVPVPLEHLDFFIAGTALSDAKRHAARVRSLLPVYRLKWACIMLNDFLPVGDRRRAFGSDTADAAGRKVAQLAKARRWLAETVRLGGVK